MKKLLVLLALFPILALAQDVKQDSLFGIMPKIDGKVHYQQVVKVDSVNQKTLFSNAKIFFAEAFGSAKSVIQTIDEPSGLIIGKGFISRPVSGIDLPFTIKIQVKEGKYKIDIYDLIVHIDAFPFGNIVAPETNTGIEHVFDNPNSKIQHKRVLAIHSKIIGILETLKKTMTNKTSNDW